jgi:uncharacterized protein (DUF2267 family)
VNGKQIVDFSDVLSAIYNPGTWRRLLLSVNRSPQEFERPGDAFPDLILRVVEVANSEYWLSTLVRGVQAGYPKHSALREFFTSNPGWEMLKNTRKTHPSDSLRVFGGKSFIARRVFRDHLKQMDEPVGMKVLVVTSGHRKVGKTYSRELIQFLSLSGQSSRPAYADLDKLPSEPFAVAAKIGKEIGLPPLTIDTRSEQATRSSHDLVDWLVPGNPTGATKTFWIVLDGFRDRIASESVQDFVAQLAQKIQTTPNYRLILINYTYRLPLTVDAFALKDQVLPIQRQDIEAHLREVHQEKYGHPPTPEQLLEYVEAVYEIVKEHTQREPGIAGDHLLFNTAVTRASNSI